MNLLFMDDDMLTKKVAEEMLESMGHMIEFASDGKDAVRIYKEKVQAGNPFNAVILDINIPDGMGGLETVSEILNIDPKAKVIATTGFSKESIVAEHKKYGFFNVIEKPFSANDLKAVLDQI